MYDQMSFKCESQRFYSTVCLIEIKHYIINTVSANCPSLRKGVCRKHSSSRNHYPFLKSERGNKKTEQSVFSSFLHFFLFLLFYSRKNIKHSENIFHILRAIQNVLHGFSSWNLFFFKTYPSSQWRLYMHNYKNKTYKQEKGRKRRKAKHIRRTKGRWNF